jgi:peptidoglycan/LPS O-acetylase OafA/YrhL
MSLGFANHSNTRNFALDGIRGLGALIVMLWHLAVTFFPCAAWGRETPTSLSWELALYKSQLWVLLSGNFAVCLFFVLSGYVLTIGYFRSRNQEALVHRIVGRPIRLGVLASASTIAIWLGSQASPGAATGLAVPVLKATGAFDAVSPHINLTPDLTFQSLLENILWLPWFQPPDFKKLYNVVLWTMHIELLGSLLAMTLAIVLTLARSIWLTVCAYMAVAVIIILALPGYGFYFALLLSGSAIAAIDPSCWGKRRRIRYFPLILAILGLLLGGHNDAGLIGSPTLVARFIPSSNVPGNVLVMGAGAILFFCGVLMSWDLTRLFSMPAFLFMGRISFSLYVSHTLVIFVVGMNVFIAVGSAMPIGIRSMTAAVASLAASIGVAAILTVLIDAPAIKLARIFSRSVLK